MFDPQAAAAELGLAVELEDLGRWHPAMLVAEFDPAARAIRINRQALEAYRQACGELSACDVRTFIDYAVAHELYHYGEAAGTQPRLPSRAQREAAADAYATASVPVDSRLRSFVASGNAR